MVNLLLLYSFTLLLVPQLRVVGGLEPITAQWAEAGYTLDTSQSQGI